MKFSIRAFNKAWKEADAAGQEAVKATTPTPMVVQQHKNMMDDNSPVVQEWVVQGGVCGFAWINLKPARGKLAQAFAEKGARKNEYEGGMTKWIHDYGQSMSLKEAYARAFVKKMHEHGYTDFRSGSRMD